MGPRAITAALLYACACVRVVSGDVLYQITDEQYYSMPILFHLDEYDGCLATHGTYCLGSFELAPTHENHQLFAMMERYSSNWVDNYNHTRLHRGLCISRQWSHFSQHRLRHPQLDWDSTQSALDTWFTACVNESLVPYNMSAHLYKLEYCRRGPDNSDNLPLTASESAFAAFVALLLALCVVSTVLDVSLPVHYKKGAQWALSWSLPGCWRSLTARPPVSTETDLRAFDGLRVVCMMCVILEHVVWLSTTSYLSQPRYTELTRRDPDVMLMTNSTLVVQIFFLMASFLLAHKLLQQRRRGESAPSFDTYISTMINRFIRVSPSYFVVLWFAASWWQRLGRGPLWAPLIGNEAAICRRKWWTHLVYLNNILYADDKCLIQTWYLAADMQLYALALALTFLLWRVRRAAIYILSVLLFASVAVLFGLAYTWRLMPTFIIHRPESVLASYTGDWSFNTLYQSPLGNAPGALAGLLLAHIHHHLLDTGLRLDHYKLFRWCSVAATPAAFIWVGVSPLLLGHGEPSRWASATFAVLERPIFGFFVVLAMLGAMHNVESPWRRWMAWSRMATPARLSFGALLLHMPLNKLMVASRLTPTMLSRHQATFEWFGVAAISYLAAIPLALLVEIPAQRLHRALTTNKKKDTTTTQNNNEKTDK